MNPNPSLDVIYMGVFSGVVFAVAIISVLYLINRGIRYWMKRTRDDVNVERKVDGGDTLHAEGVWGRRHPEEGGAHLRQAERHGPTAPRVAGGPLK